MYGNIQKVQRRHIKNDKRRATENNSYQGIYHYGEKPYSTDIVRGIVLTAVIVVFAFFLY